MHSDTAEQRRIGRYVLQDRLGRGAMGVVYRAQDPLINRTVAVKLLDILQTLSPEQTAVVHERFMREAQTAGNLDHPNIVKIYDVGRDDESGDFYIVMEYLPGDSLERRLAAGPFGPVETLELVRALASALDVAHARGIVHRDIKPANILFSDDGVAKITDFGIARITTSHLTQDVRDLGTPVFMSPEQVSGRPLDGRADLFSLGILAYQMLAGSPPFDGKNAVSLAYQIVHSTAPSLRDAVPTLPARIDDVMTKILAKDPVQRYATGKAFVLALAEVLQPTRSSPAVRDSHVSAREGAPVARKRIPPALVWGGALALGIVTLLLARNRGAAEPQLGAPAVQLVQAPAAPAPAQPVPPVSPPRSEASSKPSPARAEKDRGAASRAKPVAVVTQPPPAPAPVEHPVVVEPPAPAQAVREPDPEPAPVAVEPAHLSVTIGHWISRGTLTVYADGEPVLVRDFKKKKIVPFQASTWDPVDVPADTRELSAKVVTPKGEVYSAGAYALQLSPGQQAVVRLGLRNANLSFKRPGSEKDDEAEGAEPPPEESPGG